MNAHLVPNVKCTLSPLLAFLNKCPPPSNRPPPPAQGEGEVLRGEMEVCERVCVCVCACVEFGFHFHKPFLSQQPSSIGGQPRQGACTSGGRQLKPGISPLLSFPAERKLTNPGDGTKVPVLELIGNLRGRRRRRGRNKFMGNMSAPPPLEGGRWGILARQQPACFICKYFYFLPTSAATLTFAHEVPRRSGVR